MLEFGINNKLVAAKFKPNDAYFKSWRVLTGVPEDLPIFVCMSVDATALNPHVYLNKFGNYENTIEIQNK